MSLGDFWNVFDLFFMVPLAYHAINGFLKDVFSGLPAFASAEGNFFVSERDIRVPFFVRRSMQDFGIFWKTLEGLFYALAQDFRALARPICGIWAAEFESSMPWNLVDRPILAFMVQVTVF